MVNYRQIKDLAVRLRRRYTRHEVGRSAAALTYYLVFAAFPALVLLGALGRESGGFMAALGELVPREVAALAEQYRLEAAAAGGGRLLWSSAVFSVWLPLRATECLLQALRRALGGRKDGRHWLRALLFAPCLVAALVLALLFITVGRQAAAYLASALGLPVWAEAVWNGGRFLLLALVLALALSALYMLALGQRQPLGTVLPGAAASLVSWMAVSAGFSYYVEHLAGYERLYGSVSAVVVTLLWLYMSGWVVIMGAELNAVLRPPGGSGRRKEGL